MPIKSKPISEERKRAAAQGRLFSAGARRSAPVDDSSSTSSDDDASHHSAKKGTTAVPPKNTNTVFVDPNEDYAVASKRAALQEWLYATGQSVPAPPPKPSNMQSPAASRTRPTTQAAPAVTEKVTTPKAQATELPAAEQSPVKQRTDGHPEPRRTLLNVHEPTPATVPQPPSAPPVVEAVRPPTAAETVTDAEETANPGRREFLKLLDLFDDPPPKKPTSKTVPDNSEVEREATGAPAPSEVQSAPTQPSTKHMTIDQLAEYHFDRLYNEWLQSDADVRFIAADEWCRAEAIAVLERAGTTDLASVHQQMRQKDHSLAHGNSYSDNLRRQLTHDAALSRLEEFVVSGPFVRRINQFLHKHHKLFLDTKPARERGEHQHKEYDVWGSYAQVMEQLVVGDLKRNVDGFEEQSFFDKLFEDQEEQDAAATSAPNDTHRRAVAGLSLEAWEVVLSFMRFEHFCDMMDEYISVHYGVVGDGGSSVTGMVSALRRTSPPPTSTSTSSIPSKSAATTGTARTISTPTVGPTRPSGGVSVKSKVAAPKK